MLPVNLQLPPSHGLLCSVLLFSLLGFQEPSSFWKCYFTLSSNKWHINWYELLFYLPCFSFLRYFIYLCVYIWSYMSLCVPCQCRSSQRPEECVGPLELELQVGGCEQSCRGWGLSPGSPQEQEALLAATLSLQPCFPDFAEPWDLKTVILPLL